MPTQVNLSQPTDKTKIKSKQNGQPEASSSVHMPTQVNLSQPMDKIREQLSQCPIRTRLSLTGTLVVARDIAHAKLLVRVSA